MIVKNGTQEKVVPLWAVVFASAVMVALPAGVAWGVGQSNLAHLEKQVEENKAAAANHAGKSELVALSLKIEALTASVNRLIGRLE